MGSPDQIGRIHAGDTILDAVGERDKVEAARPRVVGQDGVVETGQRRGDGHECGTQKKGRCVLGGEPPRRWTRIEQSGYHRAHDKGQDHGGLKSKIREVGDPLVLSVLRTASHRQRGEGQRTVGGDTGIAARALRANVGVGRGQETRQCQSVAKTRVEGQQHATPNDKGLFARRVLGIERRHGYFLRFRLTEYSTNPSAWGGTFLLDVSFYRLLIL